MSAGFVAPSTLRRQRRFPQALTTAGAVAVAVTAALLWPAAAEAYCLTSADGFGCCNPGSSFCRPMHWTERSLGVALEGAGSRDLPREAVIRIIQDSFLAWQNVTCTAGSTGDLDVNVLVEASHCLTPEYNPMAGNVNSIGFVDDWLAQDLDPNAFAFTYQWADNETGEMWDADMIFNQEQIGTGEDARQLLWGVCPPEGCDNFDKNPVTADLESTMVHEAGHFLGLGHSDDELATMYFAGAAGEISGRTLEEDDWLGFCANYPRGRIGGSGNRTPRGGLSTECGGARSCNCSVITPRETPVPIVMSIAVAGTLLRRRRRGPRGPV